MKYIEIINEKRYEKPNIVDFLRQYKDDPTIYIHTTDVMKVGIYPKSSDSHDSPVGIYAFRLMDIWEQDIERWNTGDYKRGLEFLSYHGGNHLFVLQSDIDGNFPKDYTEEDLKSDCEKLKSVFGFDDNDIKILKNAATTNGNFRNCPAGYLWGMTKAMCGRGGMVQELDEYTWIDCKKWNLVLRKLGYKGFNDPGYGVIHGAESTQTLFLMASAFKVVDHSLIKNTQKKVKFGGKEYIGGRLPKNIVMNGIDNTLFYNHKPQDFEGIHSWTVKSMNYSDFNTFTKFIPWNAKGIIDNLYFEANTDNFSSFQWNKDFFKNTIVPKNITIKNITIGGISPERLIHYIPVDFPVETITVSRFVNKNEYFWKQIPEGLKDKIK